MASYLQKGLRILRNGYNPIPIKPGTKYPDIKGWQKFQTTEDDILPLAQPTG